MLAVDAALIVTADLDLRSPYEAFAKGVRVLKRLLARLQ